MFSLVQTVVFDKCFKQTQSDILKSTLPTIEHVFGGIQSTGDSPGSPRRRFDPQLRRQAYDLAAALRSNKHDANRAHFNQAELFSPARLGAVIAQHSDYVTSSIAMELLFSLTRNDRLRLLDQTFKSPSSGKSASNSAHISTAVAKEIVQKLKTTTGKDFEDVKRESLQLVSQESPSKCATRNLCTVSHSPTVDLCDKQVSVI